MEGVLLKSQIPTLVLVEKDEITLEIYQRELRKGFTVFGFTETEDVLETIANHDVQVVVIEPETQCGKGWDLIEKINSEFSTRCIPIVVCSTREAGSRRVVAQVTKYLTKPVLPQTLREKTLEAIKQRKESKKPHG